MQTRNVSLTAEQDAFIESVVRAGEYEDASEAIRDAIRALQHRRREDLLKLEFCARRSRLGWTPWNAASTWNSMTLD
jgi:antitoxin ParD1/3/4